MVIVVFCLFAWGFLCVLVRFGFLQASVHRFFGAMRNDTYRHRQRRTHTEFLLAARVEPGRAELSRAELSQAELTFINSSHL